MTGAATAPADATVARVTIAATAQITTKLAAVFRLDAAAGALA